MIRRLMFALLALLLATLTPVDAQEIVRQLPLHAELLPPQSLPARVAPTRWPLAGKQTLPQLDERTGTWDDLPLVFTTFTAPGLRLRVRRSDLEDWMPQATPSRYGFEAHYRWNPHIGFGLMLAPPKTFLPDLGTRSWLGYLASLARSPGLVLHANDDSERNPQMLRLMGERTRVLRYETPGTDDAPATSTIQVVQQNQGYTLVFALWGPVAEIDAAVPLFNSLIVRFETDAD